MSDDEGALLYNNYAYPSFLCSFTASTAAILMIYDFYYLLRDELNDIGDSSSNVNEDEEEPLVCMTGVDVKLTWACASQFSLSVYYLRKLPFNHF